MLVLFDNSVNWFWNIFFFIYYYLWVLAFKIFIKKNYYEYHFYIYIYDICVSMGLILSFVYINILYNIYNMIYKISQIGYYQKYIIIKNKRIYVYKFFIFAEWSKE